MKPTKLLQKSKNWILSNRLRNIYYSQMKLLVSIGMLLIFSTAIWIGGQYITWGSYAPYAQPEKRIYIILFIFLIWLVKFVIFDMNKSSSMAIHDPQLKYKLQMLKNRFDGVQQFLYKTTIKKEGKSLRLNQLPWCLFIGPESSGKTTLLANAEVNFALQRQIQNTHHLDPSENCDWWVTRDTSIIDVPGKYLTAIDIDKNTQKKIDYSILWKSFLQLIRTTRGKDGINSIIIALPLPELIKSTDPLQLLAHQRKIFKSLYYLQKYFSQPIPCHIVITKCDLLPGFVEFFSELGNDETTQAWGISLPHQSNNFKMYEAFNERFNSLIKKLNQQLLYRLHHERNPLLRVQIKDFPLHIEQLKDQLLDFIKKFSAAHFNFPLQHVCLTSAIQQNHDQRSVVLDEAINSSSHQIQTFQEPPLTSRAYFIRQLIAHGIISSPIPFSPPHQTKIWKKYTIYATSFSLASLISILLIKDFRQGAQQSYATKNMLSEYQLSIKQTHNSVSHLETTITLLDALQKSAKNSHFKFDISQLLTFYSNKSQEKMEIIYYKALQAYLLPEIKEYLEEYLKLPVNREPKFVYDALKSYLMLADATHFKADFIIDTMHQTLPKSMPEATVDQLIQHLTIALNHTWKPLNLNNDTIFQSRKYLSNIPSVRLGYIILKNINNNENISEIDLSNANKNNIVFTDQTMTPSVANMFTANAFSNITSKEIETAITEITAGNWVLNNNTNPNILLNTKLVDQLRNIYITNYSEVWEKILANVRLTPPKNLLEADTQIINMISNPSPLLQLLRTIHENTHFEPIISSSQKLRNIHVILEKNTQGENNLYQIFYGLQALHEYIQPVLNASDVKKAAFDVISNRLKKLGAPDPILQLRLIASKSPPPIQAWLDTVANNAWYFLVQEASHYLDMSWQKQVIQFYQADIANRYPFGAGTNQEVELSKFIKFFSPTGTITNFYNQYLQAFIDSSNPDWQWKLIDNQKLPFSEETLRQIQQALLIQQIFFPKGDNKPYLYFKIQPFKFGNLIKQVKFSINNKEIIDTGGNLTNSHILIWPDIQDKLSSIAIQVTMENSQTINHNFLGYWGWFKLVNQSLENVITRKQMLLNFSMKEQPAKYILYVQGHLNPFLALNLGHFNLPPQLSETNA